MILMYHRLTSVLTPTTYLAVPSDLYRSRLNDQVIIKAIAAYIVLGFIAVELAWFLSCRPFNGYWALPVPDGILPSFPLQDV